MRHFTSKQYADKTRCLTITNKLQCNANSTLTSVHITMQITSSDIIRFLQMALFTKERQPSLLLKDNTKNELLTALLHRTKFSFTTSTTAWWGNVSDPRVCLSVC